MPNDVSSGSTKGIRKECSEAESGTLQEFIDPVLLCRNVMDNALAIPGQMPQLSECFIRDKAAFEQSRPKQCGDPLGILHVSLTSRHILHVSGIHHNTLAQILF